MLNAHQSNPRKDPTNPGDYGVVAKRKELMDEITGTGVV
jgi:hypothetical protein